MPGAAQALTFNLGGHAVALPAGDVVEAVRAVRIDPLPGAPPVVEGVINYRGQIIAVLDVRGRFGIPAAPVDPSEHLLVALAGPRTVAFRVDRATAVIDIPAGGLEAVPADAGDLPHVAGLSRLETGVLVICDLARFLSPDEAEQLDQAVAGEEAQVP